MSDQSFPFLLGKKVSMKRPGWRSPGDDLSVHSLQDSHRHGDPEE